VGTTESGDVPVVNALMKDTPGDQAIWVGGFYGGGGAPRYLTYFGGNGVQGASGVALDAQGNVFVVGETDAPDFPTSGAIQPSSAGDSCDPIGTGAEHCYDAVLFELDETGQHILQSSDIGGSNSDTGSAVAVDASGNAYVAGVTSSDDLPLRGGLGLSPKGDIYSFVVKLGEHPLPIATPTPTPTFTPTATATPTPKAAPVRRPAKKCKKGYHRVHGKCTRKP
jgi:hypothetical protein